ncbi:hypothetical protein KGY64_01780 [Candidatus Bipolaricaulota bacterium]|nr:hypothetical protein [Candidatus Bipolaricaulota bacterium]
MARERENEDFSVGAVANSRPGAQPVNSYCVVAEASRGLPNHLGLAAVTSHNSLELFRTVADLDQSDKINPVHISEAIQYKRTREKFLLEEGV